jgi:uncharacterized protein (DUF924 family)
LSPAAPEKILSYWFSEPEESASYLRSRGRIWFGGGQSLDQEIKAKFGPSVEAAGRGELESWRDEPGSCLALILLLDQFPLNIFRNEARGYELSERSIPVALAALDQGFHEAMHPVQKSFFYLPLEHAEDLALQERCVGLFRALESQCRGGFWAEWAAGSLEWAERHLRVVKDFGRFPHRNEALGRASTPEEIAFLQKGRPF